MVTLGSTIDGVRHIAQVVNEFTNPLSHTKTTGQKKSKEFIAVATLVVAVAVCIIGLFMTLVPGCTALSRGLLIGGSAILIGGFGYTILFESKKYNQHHLAQLAENKAISDIVAQDNAQ